MGAARHVGRGRSPRSTAGRRPEWERVRPLCLCTKEGRRKKKPAVWSWKLALGNCRRSSVLRPPRGGVDRGSAFRAVFHRARRRCRRDGDDGRLLHHVVTLPRVVHVHRRVVRSRLVLSRSTMNWKPEAHVVERHVVGRRYGARSSATTPRSSSGAIHSSKIGRTARLPWSHTRARGRPLSELKYAATFACSAPAPSSRDAEVLAHVSARAESPSSSPPRVRSGSCAAAFAPMASRMRIASIIAAERWHCRSARAGSDRSRCAPSTTTSSRAPVGAGDLRDRVEAVRRGLVVELRLEIQLDRDRDVLREDADHAL